jgi:maltooligosyltrehalose trehalohydrolase
MLCLYRRLIELKKSLAPLRELNKRQMEVVPLLHHEVLAMRRWSESKQEVVAVFNLSREAHEVEFHIAAGKWRKRLDTTDREFDGPGSSFADELNTDGTVRLGLPPCCAVLYEKP